MSGGIITIMPFRLSILQCKKDKMPVLAHSLMKIFLFPVPSDKPRFFSFTESDNDVSFILDTNTLLFFPPAILIPTSLPHDSRSTPIPKATPKLPLRSSGSFSRDSPSTSPQVSHIPIVNNDEPQNTPNLLQLSGNITVESKEMNEKIGKLSGLEICDIYWRAFQISEGSSGFSSTSLVHSLSTPLAEAGISIMNISTYETDYVLVPENRLYDALDAIQSKFTILTEGLEEIECEVPRPTTPQSHQPTDPSIPSIHIQPPKIHQLTLRDYNLHLVAVKKEMSENVGQFLLRAILFPQDENRFFSYTETEDELSIMLDAKSLEDLPMDVLNNTGEIWKLIKVGDGPLGFTETGIVSSIAQTLSSSKVPLFYVSTFLTDYVLVPEAEIKTAIECLRELKEKFSL